MPAAVSKNAHSTFEWTAHKNAKVDGGNRKRHGAINETINGTSSLGTRSGGTRIIPVSKWLIVMVHKGRYLACDSRFVSLVTLVLSRLCL